MTITALMAEAKLAASKSDARRLVDQSGVSIDGERVTDPNLLLPDKNEFILKVGKRRFLKVKKRWYKQTHEIIIFRYHIALLPHHPILPSSTRRGEWEEYFVSILEIP